MGKDNGIRLVVGGDFFFFLKQPLEPCVHIGWSGEWLRVCLECESPSSGHGRKKSLIIILRIVIL